MSGRDLGPGVAAVLRVGTLLAVAAVVAGLAAALLGAGPEPGPTPVLDLLAGGGADAIIAGGLIGLTLIPVAALGVALVALLGSGERSRAALTAVVLVLLASSLAVAVLIGAAS